MTPREIALGVNAALYTLCCFSAGLATGNKSAWVLATAAFGSQTLAMLALPKNEVLATFFVGFGFMIGASAGVSLLF